MRFSRRRDIGIPSMPEWRDERMGMPEIPATHDSPRQISPLRAAPRSWLAPLLLTLAVVAAYSNIYRNAFVFDDRTAVLENPNIRSLWPLSSALWAPRDTSVSGRPLASLLLAVNYAVSKLDPWSYHLTALLLHVAAAILLWALLRRYLNTAALSRFRDHADGLALSISLLWALHPMLMECVAYVSARPETLMSVWYLATLYAALRAAERPRSAWLFLCVLCSAAGMLSKEAMASAPLVVLIADGVLLYPSWREAWRRRWPLYLGLAGTWLILLALLATNPRGKSVNLDLPDLTPATYLLTQLGVLTHYLQLAVWPHPLVLDYCDWPVANSLRSVLPQAILIVGLVAAWLAALIRRRPVAVAGAVFLGVLAPTSSLIPIASEIASERRMYLPLAALLAVVVCGLFLALRRMPGGPRTLRLAIAPVVLLGAATLAVISHQRAAILRTELTLWQDEVAKRPTNSRAVNNLGYQLSLAGRQTEAADAYRKAVSLAPQYGQAWTNLGAVLARMGRIQEAIEAHRRALQLQPARADRQLNLAAALRQAGQLEESEKLLRRAIELDKALVDAHAELGRLLLQTGRAAEARTHLELATALRPDDADLLDSLADALMLDQRKPEAVRCLEAVVLLRPTSPTARSRLAAGYCEVNRDDDAARELQLVLKEHPAFAQAHYLLSLVLERRGRLDAALSAAEQAVQLESRTPGSAALVAYQAQRDRLRGKVTPP